MKDFNENMCSEALFKKSVRISKSVKKGAWQKLNLTYSHSSTTFIKEILKLAKSEKLLKNEIKIVVLVRRFGMQILNPLLKEIKVSAYMREKIAIIIQSINHLPILLLP